MASCYVHHVHIAKGSHHSNRWPVRRSVSTLCPLCVRFMLRSMSALHPLSVRSMSALYLRWGALRPWLPIHLHGHATAAAAAAGGHSEQMQADLPRSAQRHLWRPPQGASARAPRQHAASACRARMTRRHFSKSARVAPGPRSQRVRCVSTPRRHAASAYRFSMMQ